MNKRHFLNIGFLNIALVILFTPLTALASTWLDYKPGLIQSELNQGKTVFVDFAADWCSTCKRQERVINTLVEENPNYKNAMSFVRVDWDDYKKHDVTTSRKIPRRSTLLLLRADEELGRIVAGTATQDIKALMDKAL